MAGMKFEVRRNENVVHRVFLLFKYDENGGKFYYFILSVYALILVPLSLWLWPKAEAKSSTKKTKFRNDFWIFSFCFRRSGAASRRHVEFLSMSRKTSIVTRKRTESTTTIDDHVRRTTFHWKRIFSVFFVFRRVALVIGWIVFLFLAYRVSLIEIEHKEYDPFAVLNVDRVSRLIRVTNVNISIWTFSGSIDFGNKTSLSRFE